MGKQESEVVVITGASAGVGRATVQAFARRKARIGLLARGRKGLEGAQRDAQKLGGQALTLPTDVARADQVEEAARRIEEAFGPIDIWVNAAMVSVFSPVKEMTFEEVHRVTEVTYLGAVYGTMAALKRMLLRDHGTIVQVGSALAYRSIPLQSAYCGAKHAVRGFTDSLRSELIHDHSKVHITMVQLPAVNTPQFAWARSRLPQEAQPVPPIYQPEIPAEAIYWAAHHRRRELYVGAPAVKAIEGTKIIPGLLDQYLAKVGYSGQQTGQPRKTDKPDNLWQPVDEETDFGAHGAFDERARAFSPELWATQNRGVVGALAAGVVGVGVGLGLARRRGNGCG